MDSDPANPFKQVEALREETLTIACLVDLNQPIKLSEEILRAVPNGIGLLVLSKPSNSIRLIPTCSCQIFKIMVALCDPIQFLKSIIKFYKEHSIDIVYTTGICYKRAEDSDSDDESCIYEAFIDISRTQGMSEFEIIQGLQNQEGISTITIEAVP
jgi:hypothetical protein